MQKLILTIILMMLSTIALAHDMHAKHSENQQVLQRENSKITYLGNEALLIESKGQKFLFDPFFTHDFGIYQLVPPPMVKAMKNGESPFNDITAILISHAHRDHFDADTMVNYLKRFPATALYASKQAIEQVYTAAKQTNVTLSNELISVSLGFKEAPWEKQNKTFAVDAVRIPHAGWPARAEVENLLFSLTLGNGDTIMHMGDADPDDEHYMAYYQHWQSSQINVNFPPYWFFMSAEGRDILKNIGANTNIGIHVPVKAPKALIKTDAKFFNQPGEIHQIN